MDPLVNPYISVVIPVYNRTWELNRALQSLVDQTFQHFEVIVCDDGSIEDVYSVVESFRGILRLEYRRINNSGGPARPRNIAVGMAKGDWISFLDSDDWWDNNRMATIVPLLKDGVDLLYHSMRFVAKDGRFVRRGLHKVVGYPMRGDPLRHMALFGNPIPNSSAVVRRNLLTQIGGVCEDRGLVAYEDFDTWLRLVEYGAQVRFLNCDLGSYWIGDDAISAMSERQIERQMTLFQRHVSHFGSFIRAAEARQNYTLGSMWIQIEGGHRKAWKHLLSAAKLPSIGMQLKRLYKLSVLILLLARQRISHL